MGGARGYPYVGTPTPQARCAAHGHMLGAWAWRSEARGGRAARRLNVHDGVGPGAFGARHEPCWARDVAVLPASHGLPLRGMRRRSKGAALPPAVGILGRRARLRTWVGSAMVTCCKAGVRVGGLRRHERAAPRPGNVPSGVELGAGATLPTGWIGMDALPCPSVGRGERVGCRVELERWACLDDACTWLF